VHDEQRDDWRRALAVVVAAGLIRLGLAALLPLFPDETYYWEWSRRLSGGYFDHPHGIATSIRLGTSLFATIGLDPSPFAVRLGPVLWGVVATLAAAGLAREIGGGKAALRAAIVVVCLPLAATGLVLATPDAPLLGSAAATTYAVARALRTALRSRASLLWWTLAGLALGVAFSSKYTAILVPIAVLLAVVSRRELRARLREPGPYVACIVATVVFLPVLLWNARHDWISFLFQIQHGLGTPRGSALNRELEYIGGQAGLASPILFVMMAIATWRALRARDGVQSMLSIVAVTCFGFFAYSALRKHVEPNWPALAYIPAAALVASVAWSARAERWLRAGWIFAGVLSLIVYVHAIAPILPIPARRDPIAKAYGWQQLAERMSTQRSTLERSGARVFVGADRYQDASEVSFHLARAHSAEAGVKHDWQTSAFAMNLSGRTNHYDLWPRFPDVARPGDDLVLALDDSEEMHGTATRLMPFFDRISRAERVELTRGGGVHGARRLYLLQRWRGGWPAR
jgi:4-amino-4-deoxy-L-arabinose transferase-like glycosyltransferase